ncbi:MAG: hypothetical protein QXL14_03560 [Candidatus Aenigmatarchaeota archaeon]
MTEREKELLMEFLRKELQKEDSEIIRLLREELAKKDKREGDVLDKFMGDSVRELPKVIRMEDFLKAIFSNKTSLDLQLMYMKMPVGEQLKLGGLIIAAFSLITTTLIILFSGDDAVALSLFGGFVIAFFLVTIGSLISPDDDRKT